MLLPAGVRRVRFDRMLGRCASASLFSTRRNPKSLLFFEPILKSFCDHLGNEAVENLVEKMQCGPGTGDENYILAVAGDQLTGKSTLANDFCSHPSIDLGTRRWSTGEAMRALAKDHNVDIGDISSALAQDGDGSFDVQLDYKTCDIIAEHVGGMGQSTDSPLLVIEGRQPAVMASFCQALFDVHNPELKGKKRFSSLSRVYLECSALEQAYRFISREIDESTLDKVVKPLLSAARGQPVFPDLVSVLSYLEKEMKGKGGDDFLHSFRANARRDDDDTHRLMSLYSARCHYRQAHFYDLVVDTSDIGAEEKLRRVLDEFQDCRYKTGHYSGADKGSESEAPLPKFQVQGLDHVCVVVSDVERSIQWYENVLGLVKMHTSEEHFYPTEPSAPAFLSVPPSAAYPHGGVALLPLPKNSSMVQDHKGAHFALRVNEDSFVEAYLGGLLRERLKMHQVHPGQPTDVEFCDYGVQQSLFFHDPDDNIVELALWVNGKKAITHPKQNTGGGGICNLAYVGY
jgi:catechol 2,3-dioxygenase-like lactoylglutathione lyase family enzyme/cytidylate kinase